MSKGEIIDGTLVLGPVLEVSSPFLFHSRGKSLYEGATHERKLTKAFRIGDTDYKRIAEAAAALGLTESNLIRQAALSVATSVLVELRNAQIEQKQKAEIQKLNPAKVFSESTTRNLTQSEINVLGKIPKR